MPVGCHVFTSKDDAIRLIKEKKGGRFKAFSRRIEAEEFSLNVSAHNYSSRTIETVAFCAKVIFAVLFVTTFCTITVKLHRAFEQDTEYAVC